MANRCPSVDCSILVLNRSSSRLIRFLLELLAFQSGPGTNSGVGDLLLQLLSSVCSTLARDHASLSSREISDALVLCEAVLAQVQPPASPSSSPQPTTADDHRAEEHVDESGEVNESSSAQREEDGRDGGERLRIDSVAADFLKFFSSFVASNIFAGEEEVDRLFGALATKPSDGIGKLTR